MVEIGGFAAQYKPTGLRVILYWNPVVVRVSGVVVLESGGANLQTCKPIFRACCYRNPALMAPLLHDHQEGPTFILSE
ncbi:hypothetical protein CCP4SC76_7800006 [Gammaproteobacteria bacterium]